MNQVVKSGNLMKYSDSVFSSKWKYNYVELLKGSTLRWYENKSDHTPKRSVNLKDVAAFLAFGDIIKQLPFKPELKGSQVNLMIAVPHENNRDTRLSFFLCANETEHQEWVNAILSTVSGTNSNSSSQPGSAPNAYPGAPPPNQNYPGAPPPNQNYPGAPAPNQSYPGAPPPNQSYPGAPPPNQSYPGAPPPNQSYPGGPQGYPGAPPPYQAGSASGGPPPIGFNLGMGSGPPPPSGPSQPPYMAGNTAPHYGGPPPAQPGYNPYPGPSNYQTSSVPQSNYPRQSYPGATQYVAGAGPGYMARQPPPQQIVIVDGKKRKKKHKKLKTAAVGLAAGAAGAYVTHKMFGGFGHGWGGGWGLHHGGFGGSWSSLSSFGSCSGGSWSFSD